MRFLVLRMLERTTSFSASLKAPAIFGASVASASAGTSAATTFSLMAATRSRRSCLPAIA